MRILPLFILAMFIYTTSASAQEVEQHPAHIVFSSEIVQFGEVEMWNLQTIYEDIFNQKNPITQTNVLFYRHPVDEGTNALIVRIGYEYRFTNVLDDGICTIIQAGKEARETGYALVPIFSSDASCHEYDATVQAIQAKIQRMKNAARSIPLESNN